MEHALPVVSLESLHYAITSDMYALPLTNHLQMARQKEQCRLLCWESRSSSLVCCRLCCHIFFSITDFSTCVAELWLTRRPRSHLDFYIFGDIPKYIMRWKEYCSLSPLLQFFSSSLSKKISAPHQELIMGHQKLYILVIKICKN